MNLQEILDTNQRKIVQEKQQLNEIVIAPFIYAIATAIAVGIVVDFAVEKVATILENGRRNRWRFTSGELPEGTRIYDADGKEYTYRKSGSGTSWYAKTGQRYDVLPDDASTTRRIAMAWEHSFQNKIVDFTDVDPADFDRAYSISKLGTLEGNEGKNYSELNTLYEREKRANSGVWNRMKARAKRWGGVSNLAMGFVTAFGLYHLFTQTKELIEIYKHKRDTRMLHYVNGELRRYTPEDYDRDIESLRTYTVPILYILVAGLGKDVLVDVIIRAFKRKDKMPKPLEKAGWPAKLLRLTITATTTFVRVTAVGVALIPSVRRAVSENIFAMWLAERGDEVAERMLTSLGLDYEEFWTDIDLVPGVDMSDVPLVGWDGLPLAQGDEQQAFDDAEEQEDAQEDDEDNVARGGKTPAEQFQDELNDFWNSK